VDLPSRKLEPPSTSPTKIDLLLDALVPRNGRIPRALDAPLAPYLVRLGNLKRKLLGVSHRVARWQEESEATRARFEHISAGHHPPCPCGNGA
jgi:hypothetical protein